MSDSVKKAFALLGETAVENLHNKAAINVFIEEISKLIATSEQKDPKDIKDKLNNQIRSVFEQLLESSSASHFLNLEKEAE